MKPARSERTNALPKHYLRFVSASDGQVSLFGPFDSRDILGYFYDEHGSFLKSQGDLNSVALTDSKVQKQGIEPQSAEVWEKLRDGLAVKTHH